MQQMQRVRGIGSIDVEVIALGILHRDCVVVQPLFAQHANVRRSEPDWRLGSASDGAFRAGARDRR